MHTLHFTPNGTNRTPEIMEALRSAADGTTLSFENGVYDFYKDGTYEDYFSPSCNMSCDKWVVFPILRKRNLVIEGGGATFLFHDRVFPFIVQHTDNVTLKNFTVDFSFPRYIEAVTDTVTEHGIRLRIVDKDVDFSTNDAGNLCIHVGDETIATCEKRFFLEERGVHCFLVAGDYYYDTENWPADAFFCRAERDGDGVFLRFTGNTTYIPQFTPGKRLAISYDENRMNDVIFLDRSKNIRVENVTVHRGAGMGIIGNCCENLTADGFVIEPKPGRGDLFSTTADGMLLTNFTGLIHINNCRLHNTMDDAMSIHGFYTQIERITAPDKCLVRLTHPSQSGIKPYSPGDVVTFSDGETLRETVTATVKHACTTRDPDRITLCFGEPIFGRVKAGDWVENKTKMPEVLIENSEFDTFPALRIGNPKKTVFRNNIVKNGIFLVNDLLSYWAASGCTHHLTVTGNTFVHAHIGFAVRARDDAMPHTDITVEHNTFMDCACAMHVTHAEDIRFVENTLINSGDAVFDETCKNVTKVSKGECNALWH